jgi:hypothetical protein
MEHRSLGFLPGFTPRRYQRRMPGAGTSVEHSLGANHRTFSTLHFWLSHSLQCDLMSHSRMPVSPQRSPDLAASNGDVARLTSLVQGRSKAESAGLVFTTESETAVDPGAHYGRSAPRPRLWTSAVSGYTCHCIQSRRYSALLRRGYRGRCTAKSPTRARASPSGGSVAMGW